MIHFRWLIAHELGAIYCSFQILFPFAFLLIDGQFGGACGTTLRRDQTIHSGSLEPPNKKVRVTKKTVFLHPAHGEHGLGPEDMKLLIEAGEYQPCDLKCMQRPPKKQI